MEDWNSLAAKKLMTRCEPGPGDSWMAKMKRLLEGASIDLFSANWYGGSYAVASHMVDHCRDTGQLPKLVALLGM